MDDVEEYAPQSYDLTPCSICGRKFGPDVLSRHQPICQKNAKKPRKQFDSQKQRIVDSEQAQILKRAEKQKPQIPKKQSNWRQKHDTFLQNIRQAKDVTVAISKGEPLPPPPPATIDPDYVQCEFCQRRFNSGAAERHIPFCKEQMQRKKITEPEKKKSANSRIKYQPPKLNSKKSAANRTPSSGSANNYNHSNQSREPAAVLSGGTRGVGILTKKTVATPSRRYTNGLYDEERYSDDAPSSGDSRNSSGRALRTGRNNETYSGGVALTRQQNTLNSRNAQRGGRILTNTSARTSQLPVLMAYNTNSVNKEQHRYADNAVNGTTKISNRGEPPAKFCHECGTKYATTTAKFCVECGIKRVSIPASRF